MSIVLISIMVGVLLSAYIIFFPILSFTKEAEWDKWKSEIGNDKKWKVIFSFTFLLSTLAAIVASDHFSHTNILFFLAAVVAVTLTTAVLVISLLTDILVRKVDKRLLFRSTLITGVFGLTTLVQREDWVTLTTAGVFLFLALAGYALIPPGVAIGSSDFRVMMLIATAIIPIVSYPGFMWGTIFCALSFMAFSGLTALIMQSMKVSVPAVPIFLAPYWFVLVTSPFINYAAL
jgi:hypothetical protein